MYSVWCKPGTLRLDLRNRQQNENDPDRDVACKVELIRICSWDVVNNDFREYMGQVGGLREGVK
jgi:hypothetical protein